MHYLTIVFIVWAVAATVLLALLAYRSTLTRYEEDCLFLDDCNGHQQRNSRPSWPECGRCSLPYA